MSGGGEKDAAREQEWRGEKHRWTLMRGEGAKCCLPVFVGGDIFSGRTPLDNFVVLHASLLGDQLCRLTKNLNFGRIRRFGRSPYCNCPLSLALGSPI